MMAFSHVLEMTTKSCEALVRGYKKEKKKKKSPPSQGLYKEVGHGHSALENCTRCQGSGHCSSAYRTFQKWL